MSSTEKDHLAENSAPPAEPDPAATDGLGEKSRGGAQKRRDPNQPSAVIGLGASAGGIAPLQQFFADMNPESKLAFVVVMHLSPDFESQLAGVIQQKTKMPVVQVSEPVKVRPNHVYVIPPNHQLTFVDSMLGLVPPQQTQGRRVTIDLFFRTLAQAYGQRAVCVILSGTDSDGAIGLKHVRAQGGLTIAQDPNEAEFDSMPATAISTGMVDWVLPVARMPEKLLEFVRNEDRMQLPPEIPEADDPDAKVRDAPGGETVSHVRHEPEDEDALISVLADVRAQTGHDFSNYKRATILRRVARRLQVNSIETIPQYLDFLRTHAAEGRALLQDLLIGVTHFFRDREAFAALEAHLPQLFAGRKKEDEVRVWVAGCATGEEAYSIAMLLCEHSNRLESPPSIQIFATDIDEESLADARQGLYPAMIEADVSPERLRQFFVKDQGRYRVSKDVREKVLFAKHNLLTDAPFSRCDLVSCRNLLIYLKGEAQRGVFDIFHFALRSGGLLFLGGAENDSAGQNLFSSIDNKHRIFVRRSTPRPGWRLPMAPVRSHEAGPRAEARALPALTQDAADAAGNASAASLLSAQTRRETLFGELHLRLLEQYGPPSVVVNEAHQIVHLSESVGRYLRFAAGEPTANITTVIRPEFQVELRTALFKASQSRQMVMGAPVSAKLGEAEEVVTLEVRPMRASDEAAGFYLVVFHKGVRGRAEPAEPASADEVSRDADEEIQFLKRQLASSVEQYEATNEELKASNEELQAINEELRSASEELETSKEELQSVNEELITVNHELKNNIEELSLTNADLNNLVASTDLATVFLDRNLRILRFTPNAQRVFNLIPADLGRPISDITHRMNYEGLLDDLHEVLADLHTIEREVRFGDDTEWYLARLAPYRASEDRIAGVVATFIKITERKKISEELWQREQRLLRMVNVPSVGVISFDYSGAMLEANDAFLQMVGYTREEFKAHPLTWRDFMSSGDVDESWEIMKQLRETGQAGPYEKEYNRKDGTRIWLMFVGADLGDGTIAEYVVDISGRKRVEGQLRESEERFRQFAENSADVFWILNAKTMELEYVNPVYETMFGQSRQTLLADRKKRLELVPKEDRAEATKGLDEALAGKTFVRNYRIVHATNGDTRWIRDIGFPIRDGSGEVVRIAGVVQDVTDERERSEALRESEEKLRLLIEGAPEYAMLMMDPANHIIYWSKGAERVFGWSADEALGKSGELIFTPEDRAREVEEKEMAIARKDGTAPDRRWHLRKDGTRIWVDGIMHRLDDERGNLRGYAKIARDATEQRAAQEELQQAHDELDQRVRERTRDLLATNMELERTMKQRQELEKELLEISEREKRRIGEDLHDGVCQELTATAFFLKSAGKRFEEQSEVARIFEESAQIVNRNVSLTRDLARGLQPAELKAAGLRQALRALAEQACENLPSKCHFRAARGARVNDDTIALHLFRVAQEAVKNAVKHSGAKNILVSLDHDETHVCIKVEDDGKGFSRKHRSKGLGLHLMRYRANALGGELKIEKRARGGTAVICKVPVKS